MMPKKSRFDADLRSNCSGDCLAQQYKVEVDEDGVPYLKPCGKIPFDELIQSYANTCTIQDIVRRATAGDLSALNARAGEFVDLTSTPSNLMDAFNQANKVKSYYDSLPVEIKERYPDITSFISAFDNGSFVKEHGEALGYFLKKEVSGDV